ncbi:hypothetical protein QZH41_015394, partial [Actinostola sp. cb2023]
TNRGSDFSKFINFVFPPPYCLRFTSKGKQRRYSYQGSMGDIKERCPRLLRTQRDNRDLFSLNPVIRVGGGYRRLSWKTAEVLPSIGQTEKDVTSEFTCTTCGINLAVTQEILDDENVKRFVVTYPNICANCGRQVTRRPSRSTSEHSLPPLDPREHRLTGQYADRGFEYDWHREGTTGNPDDTPRTIGSYSEYDTGFSITPDDSVFITEADGSIRRFISKSTTYHDEHHYGNAAGLSRDDRHSSQELDIIEHRDPKSGIKVRVQKRSSKYGNMNVNTFSGERTENASNGEYENSGERELSIDSRHDSLSDSTEYEAMYEYSRSARRHRSSYWKPKSRYSIYFNERNAKSDSELLLSAERYLFMTRKRRMSSKKAKRNQSGNQSHADGKSEAEGFSSDEWERMDTAVPAESNRAANSSSLVETRMRNEQRARDYPDGYAADSEGDSLKKLQAQIQQLKKSKRQKSSEKDKATKEREKSKTRNRSAKSAAKKKKSASAKKPKASLAAYGLDSESWDSDDSLHIGPISDEYYWSDDEQFIRHQRPRALSLDESELPSYRKYSGFYELSPTPRALTFDKKYSGYSGRSLSRIQRSRNGNEERKNEALDDDEADVGGSSGHKPVKSRYTSKKYRKNKVYKQENEAAVGSGGLSAENSFSRERTTSGATSSKRGRKPTKKKQKMGASRGRRGNRQRTSTLDSTETILEITALNSEGEYKSDDNVEDIQEMLHDEENTFQVAKPEKSKYVTSNKKFKSSKQVVSQRIIYRNKQGETISRDSSLEKISNHSEDEREKNEDESKGDETQAPTQEAPGQEPQKQEADNQGQNKIENKTDEQTEKKEEKKEDVIIQEKPKPKIPKPKLRGVQRVNAAYKSRVELNKRLQAMLKEAMGNVIAEADVRVRRATNIVIILIDSTIDYLAQYRLVDRSKIEVYGRAFTLEDEEERGIISYEQMLLALEGVPTIQGMSRQQLSYVLQVLEISTFSRISFKMFAVITALCEKVTTLDPFVKEIVEGLDLTQTEWKLDMYKNMFYVAGDRSVTFITSGDLRIELKAGGLSQKQEDHVINHIIQSSSNGQISFLDYMAYLPLFLSIHKNICTNALDMSRDKYTPRKAKTTA